MIYNLPLRKMLWLTFICFGAPVYVWWAHDFLVVDLHQNLPPQWVQCAPAGMMLFAWFQWIANAIRNRRSVNRTER